MSDRDPKWDPKQGDMLASADGTVHTVLYNLDGRVATGLASWPYNLTVDLIAWRNWCRRNKTLVVYKATGQEDSYSGRLARHDARG